MAEILEYKCPCCGGAISFDSSLQKLKCPYCDTEFDPETLIGYDADLQNDGTDNMNWESSAGNEWQEGEADSMRVYICKSCGGEIIGDENTAATLCPFCSNPVVFTGQLKGDLKPDYVIPFKYDKAAAKEAYKKHLSKKHFLPKVFSDENHIDEIKGLYIPFWLFDATADANLRFKGTKVRAWTDSKYEYTETSYFSVVRGGTVAFEKVPVDGSKKMADDLMESLEPFDFSEAVDFQTAYLAGYFADKYDVDEQMSAKNANRRIKQSTEDVFKSTVGHYSSLICENSSVRFVESNAHYALYPVWILNTTWQNEKFTFAMNGQTGKLIGNLPCDKKAYTKWLLGLGFGISAAVFAVVSLLWFLF